MKTNDVNPPNDQGGEKVIGVAYPKITHHGRRILTIFQDEPDRRREDAGGNKHVVERPLVGAEIGVWRGRNSATLLARAPSLVLYMVDYWGDQAAPDNGQSIQKGEDVCKEAMNETSFAAGRRRVVKEASPGAASRFKDGGLDFVFIDGDHYYEPCLADLRAWWPKVKRGGWLMGHDIDNPGWPEWGVREAVEEFCLGEAVRFVCYPEPEFVFAIRKPLL